jgi:NAD(P)-dependent dehydrogenase (short-subunit alcohol dehydrogenase family)
MGGALDFSGWAVLVTGGSNGIGHAIARSFLEAGAVVSITGTRPAAADYEADLSAFRYRQVLMEDSPSVDSIIASTDRVDVLVNNAGTAVGPPEALTPEGFEKNVAINLNAVFRLCQGLHGHLKSRPGSIINIASMYSYFGSKGVPGYGASKAAIVQLTRTLAALYAADGIRVNAIAPGWIETGLTAGSQADEQTSRSIVARTPLGRWGKPGEIAGTALYLASRDLAGFVTGATIPVDGGYSTT